jgi:hypothetical protein
MQTSRKSRFFQSLEADWLIFPCNHAEEHGGWLGEPTHQNPAQSQKLFDDSLAAHLHLFPSENFIVPDTAWTIRVGEAQLFRTLLEQFDQRDALRSSTSVVQQPSSPTRARRLPGPSPSTSKTNLLCFTGETKAEVSRRVCTVAQMHWLLSTRPRVGQMAPDTAHQWVSEFVMQYWISMYYNSWNICKATSHCF